MDQGSMEDVRGDYIAIKVKHGLDLDHLFLHFL